MLIVETYYCMMIIEILKYWSYINNLVNVHVLMEWIGKFNKHNSIQKRDYCNLLDLKTNINNYIKTGKK